MPPCDSSTLEIGPHLLEVVLALVGLLGTIFTAYRSQQNHAILKNGGIHTDGPTPS